MSGSDPNSIAAMIAALANNGGSGIPTAGSAAASTTLADYVWLGHRADSRTDRQMVLGAPNPAKTGSGTPQGSLATMAMNLPYEWLSNNPKKLQQMYAKAEAASGQPIRSLEDFLGVWSKAVQIANGSWQATDAGKNGSPLTPYDALDLMTREGQKYGFAGGANANGSKTTTSTSTSVNKLSDGDTWSVLQDAATKALGRAPTHAELRDFAAHANSIAVHNPTHVRTTTTTDANGNSSSHSTTQQGADAADYQLAAQNQTATPEAGAYQAASTYYNAMLQGLSAIV